MTTIPVNGDGARLEIEVAGYERPAAMHGPDANWLSCRVELRVGHFQGQYEAAATTDEMHKLRDELGGLTSTMAGALSFTFDESWLTLTIKMGARGNAEVSGAASAPGSPGTTLSFAFESDQSFLLQTHAALSDVCARFPIR